MVCSDLELVVIGLTQGYCTYYAISLVDRFRPFDRSQFQIGSESRILRINESRVRQNDRAIQSDPTAQSRSNLWDLFIDFVGLIGTFILEIRDNKKGKEHAVCYLSRTLTELERRHSAIERLCLALYFTAVKLRHYMLPFTIYIIATTDLIKYMLTRPMLRGRIGKWTPAVLEFTFH
ncbi:hypothetical protein L3X38_018104 [Prunus dulcis]|uniref:Reverse transcriptase RNase H-like domain-containing protein n=1 Tax=Prunus dulcis TaxID=3755 RepID=A0AAD4WAD0_PRUDU|nr:hypothetical protein L3X38_018104 [Prunus dulcis]